MKYSLLSDFNDKDIPLIHSVYKTPSVSRFISIDENNYWRYVIETDNVYFYKIYADSQLVGTIQCELHDKILYIAIVIFPQFQNKGFATAVINDIQSGKLDFEYDKIIVSIDEENKASIRVFEKSGFVFVKKEDELLEYEFSHKNIRKEKSS